MKDFNPILNNPYEEPLKYYETLIDGSLDYDKIIKGRRIYMPVVSPIPKKKGNQEQIFTSKEDEENLSKLLINKLRKEVSLWRNSNYNNFSDVTRVTKELISYWFLRDKKESWKRLFFAQREAIETTIWLNEVAGKSNAGTNILDELRSANETDGKKDFNLPRIAFKMATGTGKTVVMAMQILYHFLNRNEYKSDIRFADYFFVVTPGITIKDRLSVLFVDNETKNKLYARDYYHIRDLVPKNYESVLPNLNSKIIITNYHSLEPRQLQGNKKSPFDGKKNREQSESKEDYNLLIKRILRNFKAGSRLLILNDEAHHCYLPKDEKKKPKDETDENIGEENKRAAVWINGIAEISKRFKLNNVYDLSATPYYLSGSGYEPYTLFPWVVSDFGLIEAIESGIVKIPLLPESDTTHKINEPVLKNLYEEVKDQLPKKGKRSSRKEGEILEGDPQLPDLIKNALNQLYSNYKKEFGRLKDLFSCPPVLIIVCNNTYVSSEVFKYVAGYERIFENGSTEVRNGHLELFDNYSKDTQKPKNKPPTLLIDSDALENSNQINDSFKKIFEPEIIKYKSEYRIKHPERSVENITDAEILREAVNTVGKPGMLGEHIRCVVSVSMLTEGWDANTVTHIMGIRAFRSPLLCEQVAGRALRRTSYEIDKYGKFSPEYALIIGIPFKFFKGGGNVTPPPPVDVKYIFAINDREKKYEITFPNITGYRIESLDHNIKADFSNVKDFEIDGSKLPAETFMANAFSPLKEKLTLDDIKSKREQELVFTITKYLLSIKYKDNDGNIQFQKFNVLKSIVKLWLDTKVRLIGDAFKNMLFFTEAQTVCEHIMKGIYAEQKKTDKILPVFNYYNQFGSTKYVSGKTIKNVYETKKSHVNYVVADTESWEQIAAKTLEEMPEVISYVKNSFLDFTIPYLYNGTVNREYFPDFIARCKTKDGRIINLIIEITGFSKDKEDKKWYVENRWLPAVNGVRDVYEMDEWFFIEIAEDIRDIKNELKAKIENIYGKQG